MKRALIYLIVLTSALTFCNPLRAFAANSIDSVSIEKKDLMLGETAYWNVRASCGSSSIQQLWVNLLDPLGVNIMIEAPGVGHRAPGKSVASGIFRIPFKITEEATPGSYNVTFVTLTCDRGRERVDWRQDLSSISFNLANEGLIPAMTQPKLEKIEMLTPSERNIGDQISIHVVASSTGKINTISVSLIGPKNFQVFERWNNFNSTRSGPQTRNVDMTLIFKVGKEWPAGIWKIASVDIAGYAGINLLTPWGFDLNPTNTSATVQRVVVIQEFPEKIISGTPEIGTVPQADFSTISINVTAEIKSTSSNNKIKSVVCANGKLTKTISGTNPKCPAGYKVKS